MNANEFERALNSVIIQGIQSVDAKQMTPADLVFALESQKFQLMNLCLAMAANAARQASPLIIPRAPIKPGG